MTLLKEVVEQKSGTKLDLLGLVPPKPTLQGFAAQRSPKEYHDLAKRLAYDIVTGYVEHDRGRLDSSTDSFFRVYLSLFPEVGVLRARRAAELYAQVLVKQDEIENQRGGTRGRIIDDPRWAEVKSLFLEFSRALDIPDTYAEEATSYYRFHGVCDSRYVNHCLESDRIFTTRVLGNGYWAKILGSLYLILTECHDKHDATGLEAGLQFATKYFEIILRAKAESLPKQASQRHIETLRVQ